jgi:hypothetical protein
MQEICFRIAIFAIWHHSMTECYLPVRAGTKTQHGACECL